MTNGSTQAIVGMWDIGNDLKFSSDETSQIFEYLRGEGLVEARLVGGGISLTHAGLQEVEEAYENPTQPTEHFPPINIIQIGSMTNSTL